MDRRFSIEIDDELSASVAELTVVAIKDKESSKCAFKWALDNLFEYDDANKPIIVHVSSNPRWSSPVIWDVPDDNEPPTEADSKKYEAELEQLFKSSRIFCARKGVQIKEVILEDHDVSRALLTYVKTNHISNIVLGSTKGNAISKWIKTDVPATVLKNAPEFCSVYVVSKSKLLAVKQALRPAANTATPPKMPSSMAFPLLVTLDQLESENSEGKYAKPGHRSTNSDGLPSDKILEAITRPPRNKLRSAPVSMENIEYDVSERSSFSHDSLSDDYDASGVASFGSFDEDGLTDPTSRSSCTIGTPLRDVDAELRRLKLELKQTMEMYNNACKEAICAKKKEKELQEKKNEETRLLKEAIQAEEKTRAMLEKEKRKYKVAIVAAETSKKLAETEVKKRKDVELKLKEAEDLLLPSRPESRYRKYTIEEIEAATEKFSGTRKIGECGYGSVFKGYLDHTQVAIKVLKPDSTEGRKQFQQEIEVLSCIRHPNVILLIGACPAHGCLVYEYMDNGNLEDRLLRKGTGSPLSWRKRFKIAAEIATTLAFLHQSKPEPIVHLDLKPSNILLDRNYVSKLSDIGLACLVPESAAIDVTQYPATAASETYCYIDPEYQETGILTTKSDIYSLGLLLLQLITGRPSINLINHVKTTISNGTFEEILDVSVTDWPVEEALAFTKLALKCAERSHKNRPDLSSVIVPELNRFKHIRKRSMHSSQSPLTSTGNACQASTLVSCSSGEDNNNV